MKYFSEELNKNFDTIEELEKAEQALKEEQEKKLALKEVRKQDASLVEDAFKNWRESKKSKAEKDLEAYKEFSNKYFEIKEEYKKALANNERKLESTENELRAALREFNKKYPEGYHLTLKDDYGAKYEVVKGDLMKSLPAELQSISEDIRKMFDNFLNGLIL